LGRLALKVEALRQLQVVQRSLDEITVRMVTSRSLKTDQEHLVLGHIEQRLNQQFRVIPEYVDSIPRSRSGKFEDAICELDL
jgi:phenylacetate-CoA ligase